MERRRSQITITLPPDLEAWLDENVRRRVFANRSHGIEYCLARVKEKEESEGCRDLDK